MIETNPTIRLATLYNRIQTKLQSNAPDISEADRKIYDKTLRSIRGEIGGQGVLGAINKIDHHDETPAAIEILGYCAYFNNQTIYLACLNVILKKLNLDGGIHSLSQLSPLLHFLYSPCVEYFAGESFIKIIQSLIKCVTASANFQNVSWHTLSEALTLVSKTLDLMLRASLYYQRTLNIEDLAESLRKIRTMKATFKHLHAYKLTCQLSYIELQLQQLTENKTWREASAARTKALLNLVFHTAAAVAEGVVVLLAAETGLVPVALWIGVAAVDSLIDCKHDLVTLFNFSGVERNKYLEYRSLELLIDIINSSARASNIQLRKAMPVGHALTLIQERYFSKHNNTSNDQLRNLIAKLQRPALLFYAIETATEALIGLLHHIHKKITKMNFYGKDEWLILIEIVQLIDAHSELEVTTRSNPTPFYLEMHKKFLERYKSPYNETNNPARLLLMQAEAASILLRADLKGCNNQEIQLYREKRIKKLRQVPAHQFSTKEQARNNSIIASQAETDYLKLDQPQAEELKAAACYYGLYPRRNDVINLQYKPAERVVNTHEQHYLSHLHEFPRLSSYYFQRQIVPHILSLINLRAEKINIHVLKGHSGAGKSALAADIAYRLGRESGLRHIKSKHLIWWFESTGRRFKLSANEQQDMAFQLWDNAYYEIAQRLAIPSSLLPTTLEERQQLLKNIKNQLKPVNPYIGCVFIFDNIPDLQIWKEYHYDKDNNMLLFADNCTALLIPGTAHQSNPLALPNYSVTLHNIDPERSRAKLKKREIDELARILVAICLHDSIRQHELPNSVIRESDIIIEKCADMTGAMLNVARKLVSKLPLMLALKLVGICIHNTLKSSKVTLVDALENFNKSLEHNLVTPIKDQDTAINLLYHGSQDYDKSDPDRYTRKREQALKLAHYIKHTINEIINLTRKNTAGVSMQEIFDILKIAIKFEIEVIPVVLLCNEKHNQQKIYTIFEVIEQYGLAVHEKASHLTHLQHQLPDRQMDRSVNLGNQIRVHRITRFILKEILEEYRLLTDNSFIQAQIFQLRQQFYQYQNQRSAHDNQRRARLIPVLNALNTRTQDLSLECQAEINTMLAISNWEVGHFKNAQASFGIAQALWDRNDAVRRSDPLTYAAQTARARHYYGIAAKNNYQLLTAFSMQTEAIKAIEHYPSDHNLTLQASCHFEVASIYCQANDWVNALEQINLACQLQETVFTEKNSQSYLYEAQKIYILYQQNSNPSELYEHIDQLENLLSKRPFYETDRAVAHIYCGLLMAYKKDWSNAELQLQSAADIYSSCYTIAHPRTLWAQFLCLQIKTFQKIKPGQTALITDKLRRYYTHFYRYVESRRWTSITLPDVIIGFNIAKVFHYCEEIETQAARNITHYYEKSLTSIKKMRNDYDRDYPQHAKQSLSLLYRHRLASIEVTIIEDMLSVPTSLKHTLSAQHYKNLESRKTEVEKDCHQLAQAYQNLHQWSHIPRFLQNVRVVPALLNKPLFSKQPDKPELRLSDYAII